MKGQKTGGRIKGKSKNKSTMEVRELLDSCIDFKTVVDKLFELVKGVEVEKTDSHGNEKIYSEKPDAFAAKVLMEYRYGKPKQYIETKYITNDISLDLGKPQEG